MAVCSTDADVVGIGEITPLKFTVPAWTSTVISGASSDVLTKMS